MSFQADGGGTGGGKSLFDQINPFSSGGMSIGAIQGVTSETQKLVDAAKSGGFKISAEGVEPLRKALTDMATKLDGMSRAQLDLEQAPQLGGHAYGKTVSAHDQKTAAEGANSAKAVLEQLSQTLRQADEALARAAGQYKETEQQAADLVKKQG
ncbi:hypothetical protein [Amycolatopsis samaneae]|uniref:Excreted virulence factor EspC, type VII ESX diderm n=1 Tax=Amycolatopsis samaneae TaxID=664691 RepID=A0ABW5GFZ6_9PSEU